MAPQHLCYQEGTLGLLTPCFLEDNLTNPISKEYQSFEEPTDIKFPISPPLVNAFSGFLKSWSITTPVPDSITALSSSNMASPQIVPADAENYYGRSDIQLLASSNPLLCLTPVPNSTYPPAKFISALNSRDCALIKPFYEGPTGIRESVEQVLRASNLLGQSMQGGVDSIAKSLGIYRTGFIHLPDSEERILLLLVVNLIEGEFMAKDHAKSLLQKLISKVQRQLEVIGKEISIDICSSGYDSDFRNSDKPAEYDLQASHHSVYHEAFSCIGSSIGRLGSGNTGTLSCYITRKGHDEVFMLTNCHVLFSKENELAPYRHQSGHNKYVVNSPSPRDQEVSITNVESKGRSVAYIKSFNPELGWIFASSGLIRNATPSSEPGGLPFGRLDWALTLVSHEKSRAIRNKHRPAPEYEFGFFATDDERARNRHLFQDRWYESTLQYFNGPSPPELKSISPSQFDEDKIYLKIPGARTGFRLAQYTDIKATSYDGPCGITLEHTFCAITSSSSARGRKAVTEPGDSGTCILDSNYSLIGIAWGGNKLGLSDVTYVTPIARIFEDIESSLGWADGSVCLVGGD